MKAPKQIYIITKCIEDYSQAYTTACSLGAAFAQACHAKAMGRDVFIFLEANGVLWAFPDYKPEIKTACFNPTEYFKNCLEDEIPISACGTCLRCSNIFFHNNKLAGDVSKLIYPNIGIGSFTELQCVLEYPCNIFTF